MTTTPTPPRYRQPSAPRSERVADLLARMTLAEKLGQMGSAWVFQLAGRDGLDVERATPVLANGIGHVTRISGASSLTAEEAASLANDIQRHLADHTRLGIPAIVHEEICSGLMARDATVFPQALGVAATFRPEHNLGMADTIRLQMRAMGAHQGLSPVLDICRDPRWGRLEETYGEDPFLASAMGLAFVRGLQGGDRGEDLTEGVAATAKHFVGHGASEGGLNWAPAHLPERELRDVHLRPFEAVVRDAGLASIMNAYQELDGVPCGADRWLLHTVLREEWGFQGAVVSDYFSVRQLCDYHHVVEDASGAATAALRAGIDVELPGTDCYGEPLRAAVESGAVSMEAIDRAVARVLDAKFRLGLFEDPFVDIGRVRVHTRTPDHQALAGQMAADSLVLLRNNGILPLTGPASVAVIGPNAASARALFGDYAYPAHIESLIEVLRSGRNVFAMPLEHGVDVDDQQMIGHVPTVLDALSDRLPGTRIVHAPGCEVIGGDRSGFDDAVAAAAGADVAIVVVGDRSGLTDDSTSGESRDVASLDLPGHQEALVEAVTATGTPVVLVLVAGRPTGSLAIHEAAAAVLMAWLPGECGGPAIADALVGAASPGGRLPITWPRSSGQIPVYHGHKVSGGRSHWKGAYVDLSNEPLYAFGHGLGYSRFDLAPRPLDGVALSPGDTVEVAITVTNTGDRRADEVVQLYATDPVACVTRPVQELRGFARVTLDPGASAEVVFALSVDALGFTGPGLDHILEPGSIDLTVGPSSADRHPVGTIRVVGSDPIPITPVFTTPVTVRHRP